MVNVLDMKDLRYLNFFEEVTKVNTKYFFKYNNMFVFFVPKRLVQKSIGKDAENLRKIGRILGGRVRVVAQPESINDAKKLIAAIVSPVTFNDLEISEDTITLNAGKMNKASLIGRDKIRLIEMRKIINAFFDKDFMIV